MTPDERILDAALEFCFQESAIREERKLFRDLKSLHDGAPCFIPTAYPEVEMCQDCKDYRERSNYKGSLRNRQSAKRRMLAAYARKLKIREESHA